MKRTITFILYLLFIDILSATTFHIGTRYPIKSIKEAVRLSSGNDSIIIHKGTYRENNIVITHPIIVIGIGAPIIDGENKYELFIISSKNVFIKGLHFKNSGCSALNDYASIKIINSSNVSVIENQIDNAYFAIHVSNSNFCTIKNNIINGLRKQEQTTGNGIHLWKCSNFLIEGNAITNHRDGIYFEFVTDSRIQKNSSENNIRYGLHFMFSHNDEYYNNLFQNNGAGVAVMYSKNVMMKYNTFKYNWGASSYGLLLKDISDSYISSNIFSKNTVGIYMEGSNRININKSSFQENGWAIKVQSNCDENKFHDNNFYGNTFDVSTNGYSSPNKFYNNYWDKYEGYDMNKDGIGDVPYHPVSLYSRIIENTPGTLFLLKSFVILLLDTTEKSLPTLIPENLKDTRPLIKPLVI